MGNEMGEGEGEETVREIMPQSRDWRDRLTRRILSADWTPQSCVVCTGPIGAKQRIGGSESGLYHEPVEVAVRRGRTFFALVRVER